MEFKLPNLGEGIIGGVLANVLVREGDLLDGHTPVVEVETNKAVIEVECPVAGRVTRVRVKAGDQVPVGALLLDVEEAAAAQAAPVAVDAKTAVSSAAFAPDPVPVQAPVAAAGALAPVAPPAGPGIAAPPSVRRLARELGVDLAQVKGSGRGGRISAADVQAHIRQALAAPKAPAAASAGPSLAAPALPDFAAFGAVERVAVTGIRRATAEAMARSWAQVPMVTHFDSADVTDLEAARKRLAQGKHAPKVRVTVTVLALKALVAALRQYPRFNASFDAARGELVLKRYVNIGVAVDTEHGLVVPVLRDVDKKGVQELAAELDMLAEKARARKLAPQDMQGGCFTISNLGAIGGTGFTPIVNWPEVAILGIARARREFVWREGGDEGGSPSPEASADQGAWRQMLPLALTYDHRVIDGADAARFTRRLAELLSDPLQILMQA